MLKRRNESLVSLIPFPLKMSFVLQNRALLVKLYYTNGEFMPEDLRRFLALKNIRKISKTANETLSEFKVIIPCHVLDISKNLLRVAVENAILRLQTILDHNGQHSNFY